MTVPSFHLIDRPPPRPGAILLAAIVMAVALSAFIYAMGHDQHARANPGDSRGRLGTDSDDDDDDPSQIDTIVLGDPTDAPVPGRRRNHVSAVHPTIVIRLPRSGSQVGLIPNTAAGHLLYGWLAAFNQASTSALANALPNGAPVSVAAAQMELRKQTGGFNLLSAKEVQPGVLVFRLRDQTPSSSEVLGTLQMLPNSSPATIASLSLRSVSPPER